MTQTVSNNNPTAPAIRVPLTGQYLIEASAGTGKTWTLTGIMLRLLIEARRAPEQIIATTFTRAAAAEMRQRVHERLVNFYQLLQWLDRLQANPDSQEKLYLKALQVIPVAKKSDKKSSTAPATNIQKNHEEENVNQDSSNQDAINQDSNNDQEDSVDKKLSRAALDIIRKDRETWLIDQAKLSRYDEMMQDPINLYLITYLIDHVQSYPLAEAIGRTALVLTTLDRLFIGTLDSLAQKWLAEYSSETGHQQRMAIIEDADIKRVTQSIVHDELRQFQSRLYHQQPKIFDLLEQQGKLTTLKDHQKSVDKSLDFISAPIDSLDIEGFKLESYNSLILEVIKRAGELDSFFKSDGEYFEVPKGQLSNNRHVWQDIIADIQNYNINAFSVIQSNKLKSRLIEAFQKTDIICSQFYKPKNGEQVNHIFNELPVVRYFKDYIKESINLESYLAAILTQLNRHIALTVRQKLPLILEERGETTFTLQMVRLNQALTGQQGDKLARYIRHHYPVALIDESQDINGEQASMIEQIYLFNKQSQNPPQKQSAKESLSTDKGFLLLVGDPKQAIYGFRGGDVANYNHMKQRFNSKAIMSLNVNRRSNARLIDALNHWFGSPDESVKSEALSELGDNIHYQYITAIKENAKLSWLSGKGSETDTSVSAVPNTPKNTSTTSFNDTVYELLPDAPVSLIHLPYDKEAKYDEFETTALHIAALLKSGQTLDSRPIQPSDIGVLGRTGKQLKQVEDMLIKLKVPTLATSVVSVFETVIAADIAALMAAMLHPYRRDMINRVLTSQLYGLTLVEVKAMMISHDTGVSDDDGNHSNSYNAISEIGNSDTVKAQAHYQTHHQTHYQIWPQKSYQDFITTLKKGALQWQNWGILSALHFLLDSNLIQPQGVWQALASLPEGERHIMDLRQVMDILAQYSSGMGEHELLAWFRQNIDTASTSDWAKQHPLPTESGVQLMTIHKSKGLEFPIVYVLGMDKASKKAGNKEEFGMYLYNAGMPSSKQASNQTSNHVTNTTTRQTQRRLSPVQGTLNDADYYTDQVTQEDFAELKRLAYVAFTRASEQLYLVLKDPSNKTDFKLKPMFNWLDATEAKFELPDRLKPIIGWLSGNKVGVFFDTHKQWLQSNLDHDDKLNEQTIKINYPPLTDIIPTTYFTGWAKTSFTALARQLDDSAQAIAVVDERIDDDIIIDTSQSVFESVAFDASRLHQHDLEDAASLINIKPDTDIRFSFVRGANAGTFLHEIFEKIDFSVNLNLHISDHKNLTQSTQWSLVIDRAISSYQIPLVYASAALQARLLTGDKLTAGAANTQNKGGDKDESSIDDSKHQMLKNWISEVLTTPLLASQQALKDIAPTKRFAELSFNMGLSEDFKPQDINDLFKTYLPDDPDKHINLKAQDTAHLYRYLRGEIDLVYEHASKYYVVDYKSNHLGNSLSDYDQITLNTAMNKAGYWLQAAIYQVALHRFLSMRIKDYIGNEAKYLGAVEYVFIRGTYNSAIAYSGSGDDEEGTKLGTEVSLTNGSTFGRTYGLVTWDIPIDFLKALDNLFGKPTNH